jgi:hypothetical protein
MFGTDDPSSTSSMPALGTAGTSGFYQPGNPLTNLPATTITLDHMNIITSELLNLVTSAGLTPTKATLTQVTTAVQTLGKRGASQQYLYFSTPVSAAGGSTTMIGPSGVSTSDSGSRWIMPVSGTITAVYLSVSAAPGGSQTCAGTVFLNGSSTAAVSTVTGAATSTNQATSVSVAATNAISLHLVMSATAATAYVSGYVLVTPS